MARTRHAEPHRLSASLSVLLLACCVALPAAAPPARESPDDLIRRANAAFTERNYPDADRLYALAEELTTDPGLVAFNRGALLFRQAESRKEEYRNAEFQYDRVLGDAACPPERAARAWYNRGTCRLHRGETKEEFWAAVEDFERCLDSPAADAPLKADARQNLELAKLCWDAARKKEAVETKKPAASPNDNPPRETRPELPPNQEPDAKQPDASKPVPKGAGTTAQTVAGKTPETKSGQDPSGTPNPTPVAVPDLQNAADVQPLSPDDTREHLRKTAARLKKDRRDLWKTLHGETAARVGVRDW